MGVPYLKKTMMDYWNYLYYKHYKDYSIKFNYGTPYLYDGG